MKPPITDLRRELENRVRLGIMSVLAVNDESDFSTLKGLLEVTDGNLASHLATLERGRFLKVKKSFVHRKPQTTYRITEQGRRAFAEHLDALERVIRSAR